jgi:hypothetical protein
VDSALRLGLRGLPRGSSLAQLLAEHRGVRNSKRLPALTRRQILAWADAHHRRTGAWPVATSGPIPEPPGETWMAVDRALVKGLRQLPGGSSLARLLAADRGVRNRAALAPLTLRQILAWADAHHARTQQWPTATSGPIPEAPGETWNAIHVALVQGHRQLPGGFTLAQLLADQRGVVHRQGRPRLTLQQILIWADAHYRRLGRWPRRTSGPIFCTGGETWARVDNCLQQGDRGLPGGLTLAQLLAQRRGVPHPLQRPRLTVEQILELADAHHARTGVWPTCKAGAVAEAPGESWRNLDAVLRTGGRGLSGGSSLAQLLCQRRGVRNPMALPELSVRHIRAWAVAHERRTGQWPGEDSGAIAEAPGETWRGVDWALREGKRGLPGGSSLYRLRRRRKGPRRPAEGAAPQA